MDTRAVKDGAKVISKRLGRLGFLTRGGIYLLMGLFILQAALGLRSPQMDQTLLLIEIVRRPFGQLALALIALGLFSYAIWNLVQGAFDPENRAKPGKNIGGRVGNLALFVGYSISAITAGRVILGYRRSSDAAIEDITSDLLQQPFGSWLVGISGLTILVIAGFQLIRSLRFEFDMEFKEEYVNGQQRKFASWIGAIGNAAVSLILAIVGIFFVDAAINLNSDQAGGLGQVLSRFAQSGYGPWLLVPAAIGLIAFGTYSISLGLFRKMKV